MGSFIDDVICWHRDGYLDTDVWNHLQRYVQNELLLPITTPSSRPTESLMAAAAKYILVTQKGKFKRLVMVQVGHG